MDAGRLIELARDCGMFVTTETRWQVERWERLADAVTNEIAELEQKRKAEADIVLLRSALAGLIGADTSDELKQIEAAMRLLPAQEADKAVSINAIHALLATMPPNDEAHRRDAAGGPSGGADCSAAT